MIEIARIARVIPLRGDRELRPPAYSENVQEPGVLARYLIEVFRFPAFAATGEWSWHVRRICGDQDLTIAGNHSLSSLDQCKAEARRAIGLFRNAVKDARA